MRLNLVREMKRMIKSLLTAGILVSANSLMAQDKIYVSGWGEQQQCFLYDSKLYAERWDTLAQPTFWREVIRTSPDTVLINIASTRTIVKKMALDDWNRQSEPEKEKYRQKIRENYGLPLNEKILVTSGKSHFYKFENAIPHLGRAITIFEEEKTDPWYAQAILLIESPSHAMKSNVGAHGSFQLMPDVARLMGLTVNSRRDDRLDFDKSAAGAAKLIRTICIPQVNEMLDKFGICEYDANSLWYRLLVMHVYHAGAGNVSKAMAAINPSHGSMALIRTLWQTEAGGFRNASQNYSQIALASMMELYDLIYKGCIEIHGVSPL